MSMEKWSTNFETTHPNTRVSILEFQERNRTNKKDFFKIYYEVLVHTIMGAEKSHICHPKAGDPVKLVVIQSKGLRIRNQRFKSQFKEMRWDIPALAGEGRANSSFIHLQFYSRPSRDQRVPTHNRQSNLLQIVH